MTREEHNKEYPWLQGLTDEQVWKLWLMVDRVHNWKGYDPCPGYDPITGDDILIPITTPAQAANLIGAYLEPYLSPGMYDADIMEDFEDELQRAEEFKLASWLRKLRHERETVEEERLRYQRQDERAEELAKQRQRRRPRG